MTPQEKDDILKAMSRARTQLIMGSQGNPARTFYATLSMRLRFVPDESTPWAATDGVSIYLNPRLLTLPDSERVGVLAHEVDHCARLHICRMEGRDKEKWNQATDLHINRALRESGYALPSWVLHDASVLKRSEEETYYYLPEGYSGGSKGQQKAGNGPSGGDWNMGGVLPAPTREGESQSDAAARVATEWQIAVEQAAMIARAAGTLPGHIESLIQTNRRAIVDWKREMEDFLTTCTQETDRTWARPNRRMIGQGIYLPSTIREGCGTVVVMFDTSGSVSLTAHEQFAAEIKRLHAELRPARLMSMYVDTTVQKVLEFGPDDEIETPYVGGGGTYFAPGFDWLEEQGITPDCVVYLTDLEPADDPEAPEYPVLWVSVTPDKTWRWGRTVHLDVTRGAA